MKPQDILLLLKLVSIQTPERDDWTDPTLIALHSVRALAQATGISKSEVALSLQRSLANGLARRDVRTDIPLAVRPALIEFLTHGLRYVYPAAPGSLTRGMITGGAAVPGPARLTTGDALAPVWPDPAGRVQAMDSLQAALSDRIRPVAMSPLQQAFYVAVLSMIERTKEAVAKAPARAD